MTSLKDKNVIVTGSSRGIGAGIALRLAEEGAHVVITYSSGQAAAEKVLASLPGQGHMLLQLNIGDSASVESGFARALEKLGTIDGLVNNAGITRDALVMRMKEEDFDSVIQTNLRGAFLCTKAVMRPMLKARRGSIVNISSVIGQMGNSGQANYAASKAGLEGFSRSVAMEVASRGIRVNAVAPGFIVTDMTNELDAKQRETIEAKIPMERLGTVKDVADPVVFLLSDMSTYITGQVLQVNGGLYM
jgi:3-oxoacyl-[acyl-carrier protein] reductase